MSAPGLRPNTWREVADVAQDIRTYRREYMQRRRAAQRESRPASKCLECNGEFLVVQGNKKYCSDDCARVSRLRRRRDSEYRPEKLQCLHCKDPVPYKSGQRRYCSPDCRKAAVALMAKWRVKGIGPTDFEERCALCGAVDVDLVIDHDHRCCPTERACGKCVRGLLCRPCNVGLGMFKDNPELLLAAAKYVVATADSLG